MIFFALVISLFTGARLPPPPEMIVANNQLYMRSVIDQSVRTPTAGEIKRLVERYGSSHRALLERVFEMPLASAQTFLNSTDPNTPIEIKLPTSQSPTADELRAGEAALAELAGLNNAIRTEIQTRSLAPDINQDRLREYLAARDQCLENNRDPDVIAMYDALAQVLSDRNCTVASATVVQRGLTRGITIPAPKPEICNSLSIPATTSGIGFGHIEIRDHAGATNRLQWDANHLTPMAKENWLTGLKQHSGFYSQLSTQGFCGGGTPAPSGTGAPTRNAESSGG